MNALATTLTELEAVTARMLEPGRSLADLAELCARREELVGQLGELEESDRHRAQAVLRMGAEVEQVLQAIRESLRRDLRELDRSICLAREWGAALPPRRGVLAIDA